jgi:enamine deaminase RidA (YjgF/YER057c/UK114 family)
VRRIFIDGPTAFRGYPNAVSAAGLLFLSGVRPASDGSSPTSYKDLPAGISVGQQGFRLAEEEEEEVAIDAWAAHDALDRVLAAVGANQEHMLRMRVWQRDKRFYPSYERVRLIRQPKPSASSGHAVSALVGHGSRAIGLDGVAIAVADVQGDSERNAVGTAGIERPLTYYSVAAQHGDYAFLAGHIPVKSAPGFPTVQSYDDIPSEGRLFATNRSHADSRDGPIAAQTWYVYDQMRQNLAKIGAELGDIAHCLVGLRDLRDLPMFHRVHRAIFGDNGPALTIVGAGEVGHRNSSIVIEPTIYLSKKDVERSEWLGEAPLSAPMTRRAGKLLFVSGMAGIDREARYVNDVDRLPPAGQMAVRHLSTWSPRKELPAQCWQAWSNLSFALSKAGSSLENLIKITVFLSDPGDWPVFDAVRSVFIDTDLPAIECVAVPNPGPTSRSVVQIDAVALAR